MRTAALYNKVYNRKKAALLPGEVALIQVEICTVDDGRKYLSTDIYVEKHQFDKKSQTIINHPLARELNRKITDMILPIQERELEIISLGRAMNRQDIESVLNRPRRSDSFIEFMQKELDSTKYTSSAEYLHKRVIKNLKELGIVKFTDLTYSNIVKYDRYIKGFLRAQTSVYKQHATIKTYIIRAQKMGLMKYGTSPYLEFDVSKGKSRIRTRLDDTEIEQMENVQLSNPDEILCRDMYMFSVYTGMAYKDVLNFNHGMVRHNADGVWIEGLRKKNGELYTVFLIDQALEIIQRYPTWSPHATYTQNRMLKVVAARAGVNKVITCHTGRHSAASWMLRKGVPVTVLQQILGHENISSTMIYARLERRTIREEMSKLQSTGLRLASGAH